ncbi:nitronate monooxygenase [Aquincola sp. MAHUQ-54]|uniref:Nitronate monooxygenase n=1 Tax=Aquincola agrisoli TaxID=3119538 RepID=A0AAW9QAQ3_9BURK
MPATAASPFAARLGIQFPVIQAPMAGSQGSRLALAVSAAGGLGSLPAAMLTADALRAELAALQAGGRPYNVNFFCHRPPEPDAARDAAWRGRLAALYDAEFGLDLANAPAGAGRAPFTAEIAALVADVRPPVISFHFGLPTRELLDEVKRWGSFVLSSATTVDEARWLEAHGADAVIAQGWEAGGHRGHFLDDDLTRQPGLFALLPQVVDAVKLPVVAAGGIADARGVRAAFALGASAVQVGTAYLRCPEAGTSALHRAALGSPDAAHTALTNVFSGRPARGIVNRAMRELGPLADDAPRFPNATAPIAPLRAAAEKAGTGAFSPLWAGQHVAAEALDAAALTAALARGVPPDAP